MSDRLKQARDQLAHALAACVAVSGACLIGAAIGPVAGGFIGLCLGATREATEWQRSPAAVPWSRGSLIDLACWMTGGVLAGWQAHAL